MADTASLDDLYGPTPKAAVAHRTGSVDDLYGSAKKPARAHHAGNLDDLYGSTSTVAPSPLAGFLSAGGTTLERLGVPRAIDILSRPGKAGTAFFAGDEPGDVAHAFTSGDPDQYAADVDRVKQHLGLKRGGVEQRLGAKPLDSDRLPGWGRGLLDAGIETLTDPTTVAGAGVAQAGGSAATAAARALTTGIGKVQIGRDALDIGRGVGEAFTFGRGAKRELGSEQYHDALAADNRQTAREAEAKRRLTERYDATFGHLSDDEKHTAFSILNGERQATDPASGRLIVPQHVATAARDGRKLLNDAAGLQADASGRRRLAYNLAPLANANLVPRVNPWDLSYASRAPGKLTRTENPAAPSLRLAMTHPDDVQRAAGPRRLIGRVDRPNALSDDLREFAAPDDQGVLGAANLRRDYLPGPRAAAEADPKARPQPFNLLRPFAPNVIARDAFTTTKEDVPAIEDAVRRALANAARQGTAGRLRDEVGAPLGLNAAAREPTALEKLFDVTPRATGDARLRREKAADLARGSLDVAKNVVTGFGLKHGLVNVPTLALLSEGPGAALEALARGAAIARKSGAERYDAVRKGVEGGVVTPSSDRTNALVDATSKLPVLGKTLGALARGTNTLTWAIDDAAKQAVLRRKLARGMTPAEAAGQTLREMVDYRHRSDATKALGLVAPFATFRSRLPAAVASSVSRNPARTLALDRAAQGFASNGRVDVDSADGTRRTPTVSNPLSDVMPLLDEPQKYARATMGDPLRILLSPAGMDSRHYDRESGKMKKRNVPHYSTYGEPLEPHYDERDGRWKAGYVASQAASYLPFGLGDAILKGTGTNELPAEDWISTLLGGVLGVHVR